MTVNQRRDLCLSFDFRVSPLISICTLKSKSFIQQKPFSITNFTVSAPLTKFNYENSQKNSTYIRFTATPTAEVINITVALISKSLLIMRSTAKYTRTPVTTQMSRTEVRAPITSARYQPNDMVFVGGLVAIQSENSEIMKLAKSVSRCAASVAIARLLDR